VSGDAGGGVTLFLAVLLCILAGGLLVAVAALWRLSSRLGRLENRTDPGAPLGLLQQQLDALRSETTRSMESQAGLLDRRIAEGSRVVGDRLDASGKTLDERLGGVSRTVLDLRQQLGQVQEASLRIFEVGRSIASLQDLLRAPKIRGGLGELLLADLLRQILPEGAILLQHAFRSGTVVDAAIRAGDHLVPIDSKFPLENFVRMTESSDDAVRAAHRRAFLTDVRRHIDAISTRYILPAEGTLDFALMYIPAENVYYETIIRGTPGEDGTRSGLFEHALGRRVIPVSPNTLYAYLQVILMGLRGLHVDETAKEIVAGVQRVSKDLGRFRESFETLGRHLGNAAKQQETALKQLDRIGSGVESLLGEGTSALSAANAPARPLLESAAPVPASGPDDSVGPIEH
jgi:DNA recombination protein RmuC